GRGEAKQRGVVHARRVDYAARIEQCDRIQTTLDGAKGFIQGWTELPADPFAATQAVAVLAAVSAPKLAHKIRGLLGDGTHPGGASLRSRPTHVENRPHVQRSDGGMR